MAMDLSALNNTQATGQKVQTTNPKAGSSGLSLDDFLQLVVAQFQNQDPENAASTTDMMNMLVQMSVVQALATVTDAATMLYSSSLVGKEVTVGQIKDGKLEEIVGTVTATGTYGGEQVIFLDGVSYKISDIMAVGRLPEKPVDPDKPVDPPDPEAPDQTLPPAGEGESSSNIKSGGVG